MEYRRLRPDDDFAAVADFAIAGMRAELYPMLLSRAKIDATVRRFAASPTDFHMAAFDGGRIVGALAAVVAELPWHERCAAHVVMGRAVAPGTGRVLIRALRDWADADMRIRVVQWPMEFHSDPRIARLLQRYGFGRQVTTCLYYPGRWRPLETGEA